jgi:rubrerythrin
MNGRGELMSELREQLEEAIRREKEAYDLYRLVSAGTGDPRRREFSEQLAQDAVRHVQIIERTCREHLPSLFTFAQHFVPEIEFADGVGPPDEERLFEALETAIAHKCHLIELYGALAEGPQESPWSEMFRELLAAEEEHLKFVQTHLPSVP